MTSILYTFIIQPLYLLFEFIFVKAYYLTQNYGVTIICLSLVVNFLILPLYRRADAIQKAARDKEKELSFWTNHIKKTFKGDERYMLLTTYYRQNNYKQTDSLKSSISLLLQIPFFIAAYRFLSGLEQLQGVSFGPLQNLGAPDGMLNIAGLTINVMPILMSVVNILSGSVYGKDLPLKSKLQMYGIALVFLVLLYHSPSGLVFYWTLNNIFSLIKNIITKSKHANTILASLSFMGSVFLLFFIVVHPVNSPRKLILILGLALMLGLFGLSRLFPEKLPKINLMNDEQKPRHLLFFSAGLYLSILIGLLIPSAVISSSPGEFIDQTNFQNPQIYSLYAFIIASGLFLGWMTVFYMLANIKGKQLFSLALWILSGIFTVNYMFFGKNLGTLSNELVYNNEPYFSPSQQMINLAILLAVAAVLCIIYMKLPKMVPALYAAMGIGICVLFVGNLKTTQDRFAEMHNFLQSNETEAAKIPLSQKGKNVVILMMDRCIGPYVPYLFNERPELKKKFAGFTYYPNTVSMGTSTNIGAPALYGGYEYSPYEINLRPNESLKDKHNEALKVLPVLFSQNGFISSVYDPPYANYTWIPDLSIYDEYPEINAYHTIGKFDPEIKAVRKDKLKRNFFCYSVFKVMPLAFSRLIYDNGTYNNTNTNVYSYTEEFMDNYSVLTNLPNITEILDDDANTFMIMENKTTHEPCVLQLPEYVPVDKVDSTINAQYEKEHQDRFTVDGITMNNDSQWKLVHYYADMAAMQQLALWFDYLQENNLYDNTRIIIVSDHGYGMPGEQFDNLFTAEHFNTEWFRPIMMVKDFDSKGAYQTSYEYMTNADTPALAAEGLIDHPTNPFTGKELTTKPKESDLIVFHSTRWGIDDNNGNVFKEDPDNRWFIVHDNILDMNNWTLIDNPTD